MCTVLLPPGDNPIAVNKYIISYHNVGRGEGGGGVGNTIAEGQVDLATKRCTAGPNICGLSKGELAACYVSGA